MSKRIFLVLNLAVFLLILGPLKISAQTDTAAQTAEITQIIQADENIGAADLDIKEPKLLPDSPFYFAKNIWRGMKSAVTFNPIKKAELKLGFANEKIIEAKISAEKTDEPEIVKKALENFKKETDEIKKQIERIKEKASENPKVDALLEKFVDNNLKQQKLIGKLEKELPQEMFEKIKEIKEETLSKFSDITLKLSEPEILKEKIEKAIEKQAGSEFKNFKNLEVLKEIENKVPEVAKEAIRRAQENALKRLRENIETATDPKKEMFKDYVKNIGGNELRHLEIIDDLSNQKIPAQIREIFDGAKEETFKRVEEKMKGLKEEKRQEEFLKHLEGGKTKDIRIIKDLENNLSPEIITQVLEIKNKAMNKFKESIEQADTPEKQEQFFGDLEKFHDVNTMAMFQEMEQIIPPEKKDFWGQMKEKAKEEMAKEVGEARTVQERQMVFEKLASDSPEGILTIKDFAPPPQIMQEIMKEQMEQMSKKIESTQDAQKLMILKEKVEEKEEIKKELEARNPEIFRKLENKEENFFKGMDEERAKSQIEKAKQELDKAESEFRIVNQEMQKTAPVSQLLELAKKEIQKAEEAMASDKIGEAFGQATAGLHKANSALRKIKQGALRQEVNEKRQQEFEQKFEKEMMPSQILEQMPDMMRCPMPSKPTCQAQEKIIMEKDSQRCMTAKCVSFSQSEEKNLAPTPSDFEKSSREIKKPLKENEEKKEFLPLRQEKEEKSIAPEMLKPNETIREQFKEMMPYSPMTPQMPMMPKY